MKFKRPVLAVLTVGAVGFFLMTGPASAVTGQLDPGFGNEGIASPTLDAGDPQVPVDSIRQPDGSFVVVGYSKPGPKGLIARLLPDGSPDPGFGSDGAVESGDVEGWDTVAHQPDGKIVVAGRVGTKGVIARFNPDGSPDTGYGTDGQLRFDPTPLIPAGRTGPATFHASALTILSDGRIRTAGRFLSCGDWRCENQLMAGTQPDGSPDTEFGANGVKRLEIEGDDATFTIDADGTATSVSEYEVEGEDYYHGLRALQVGSDGEVTSTGEPTTPRGATSLNGTVDRLTKDPQGRILLAQGGAVIRFNSDRTLDKSFGTDGSWWGTQTQLPGFSGLPRSGPDLRISDVWIDAKQRILLAGAVGLGRGSSGVVIRLDSNGRPDPTFGAGGMTVAWLGSRTGLGRHQGFATRTRLLPVGPESVLIAGLGPHGGTFGINLASFFNADAPPMTCDGRNADYIGTDGDDVVTDVRGAVLVTLGGDDRVTGSYVSVCAGSGDDVIDLPYGPNTVYAGSGRDRIKGSPQRDTIYGGNGKDRIAGMGGADRLYGRAGHDLLRGGAGDDLLKGGPGRDRLFGGIRDDRLYGGPGTDTLSGGGGFDRLIGGPGRDALRPGPAPGSRYTDYFYRSKRIRLKLVPRKRKVKINGKVRVPCDDQSIETVGFVRSLRIHPGGRFRDRSRNGGDYISVSDIQGRVSGRSITGQLRFIDSFGNQTCSTGKRPVLFPLSQAWVSYHAKVRPRQRQIARQ